jgi:hypothetical protein
LIAPFVYAQISVNSVDFMGAELDAVMVHPLLTNSIYKFPASIAHVDKTSISASVNNPYGISGWHDAQLSLVSNWKKWNGAFSICQEKLNAFRRHCISIGFARKVSENISVGLNMGINSSAVKNYSSQREVIAQAGFFYPLGKQVSFSTVATIEGLVGSSISRVGGSALLGYTPINEITLSVSVYKKSEQMSVVSLGVHYQLIKTLFVRTYLELTNRVYGGQLGLRIKKCLTGCTISKQQSLGFSSGVFFQCELYDSK